MEFEITRGKSGFDIFSTWQDALCEALQELGHQARLVGVMLGAATPKDNQISIGFNLVRAWSKFNKNHPHFSWMVDHPLTHLKTLCNPELKMPVNFNCLYIGNVDRRWVSTGKMFHPHAKLSFLPHPSVSKPITVPNFKHKDIDVALFGSIGRPDHEWSRLNEIFAEQPSFLEKLRQLPKQQTEDLAVWIFQQFTALGWSREKARERLLAHWSLIDAYYRHQSRLNVVQAMEGINLHIFGNDNWNHYPLPESAVVNKQVTYAQALEIFPRCKLLLCHTPTLAHGSHERVFDGLARGSAILSTPSSYLKEEFGPRGISFYSLGNLRILAKKIKKTLADPALPDQIEAAQKVLRTRHRMIHRAQAIVDILAASGLS